MLDSSTAKLNGGTVRYQRYRQWYHPTLVMVPPIPGRPKIRLVLALSLNIFGAYKYLSHPLLKYTSIDNLKVEKHCSNHLRNPLI